MSAKNKSPEPPKTNEAPAYMGQFASLMTILLAFFVLMLTLGQDRVAKYKDGVGNIRNLIGLQGGTGVLEFWRSLRRPPAPKVLTQDESTEDAMLVGYERGSIDTHSLDESKMQKIDFEDPKRSLRIRSAIRFERNSLRVTRETQFALDQAAALLYSASKEYRIVAGVISLEGDAEEDRLLAARRASWLTRHLIENARIPANRIRSMGITRTPDKTEQEKNTEVFFLLRKAI